MAFKDAAAEYRLLDLSLLDPDPEHPRRQQDEAALKGLAHAIGKKGVLQPLLVQPADAAGRYRVIVGERRRQAALLAGETQVPALIRACPVDEVLEVQVFENLGLGVRAALEPLDMANAIQRIADRFDTPGAAAEQFGRSPTWLNQATAAANLSPKVSALLESGKIGSATTAVQIEKLAQKDEASAESLLEKIEQLAEGEKLPRELVEEALTEAGVKRRKKDKKKPAAEDEAAGAAPVAVAPLAQPLPAAGEPGTALTGDLPPWETGGAVAASPASAAAVLASAQAGSAALAQFAATGVPVPAHSSARDSGAGPQLAVHPDKMRQVAALLGLDDGDEATILDRLIDEFLALKGHA